MFNSSKTPYRNQILEFEDIIDLYTPGSIDRKVLTLDSAWQLLKRKYPDDDYILTEVRAWEKWSKEILDSNWFYKTLPTGIMDEYDEWEKRYKQAYLSVSDKRNLVKPSYVEESLTSNPAFWGLLGFAIGIGVCVYVAAKR